MIKVCSMITLVELDGKEMPVGGPTVGIHSHWNRSQLIILEIDGKRFTVSADDLVAAIRNAQNTNGRGL